MNENRRQILEMLAAGRITTDEAERLLAALEPETRTTSEFSSKGNGANGVGPASVKNLVKYLRVLVEADQEMTGLKGPTTVNVRVPLQLLRAGVRLASLIPAQAHDQLDEALSRHGVPSDAFADQAGEPGRADRPPERSDRGCRRQRREHDQGAGVLRVRQRTENRDQGSELRDQGKRRIHDDYDCNAQTACGPRHGRDGREVVCVEYG